jgi:hypothetical protein
MGRLAPVPDAAAASGCLLLVCHSCLNQGGCLPGSGLGSPGGSPFFLGGRGRTPSQSEPRHSGQAAARRRLRVHAHKQ